VILEASNVPPDLQSLASVVLEDILHQVKFDVTYAVLCCAVPCSQVILEASKVSTDLQSLASVVYEDILQPLQTVTQESKANTQAMRRKVRTAWH
jgi:hypothetical protein